LRSPSRAIALGHEDRADDGGVEEDGDAEAEPELLDEDQAGRGEPGEDRHHDQGRPVMIFAVD
jgi:hypothetical protein